MSHRRFWHNAWFILLAAALLGALLAAGFSLRQPQRYSSSMRLLITQTSATGLDPYTALKTADRLAQSFSELIYTTTIFNNILIRAQGFDANYFSADENQRRQEWQGTLGTSVVANTGMLMLTAYHPNRDQAKLLVQATAQELVERSSNFFGPGVKVQIVDEPLPSRWIAQPDYSRKAATGALLGLALAAGWLVIRASSKHES